MNEILINSNEKLLSLCDVRNMNCVTKQSIRFVCHPLFKSCSWYGREICDNVEAGCYVETWSANAICQGIFMSFWLGFNNIKLYAVYTCMGFMYDLWCVCSQFRITATRPRKVKFCCVAWHGIVTVLKTDREMRHAVAVIDKIWNCYMYL